MKGRSKRSERERAEGGGGRLADGQTDTRM